MIPPVRQFDTTSLEQPMSDDQRRALKARLKSGEFGPRSFEGAWLVVGAVIVIVVVSINVFTLALSPGMTDGRNSWARFLPLAPFLLIGLVVAISRLSKLGGGRDQWLKLALLADRNGLAFRRASDAPSYPGLLFGIGSPRRVVNHLYAREGLFADAGGYRYTTGSGKNRNTHRWNFAAFRLPAPMPHLVLDSRSNDTFGFTNLPVTYASVQQVPIGAPVSDRYRLLAPEGYGQDALYLFPPDALADLMNTPAQYDIEIVDDWLFLYTKDRQDLTDPQTWQMLEQVATGLVSRVADLATRYRDGRLVPPSTPANFVPGSPEQPAPETFLGRPQHLGSPGTPARAIAPQGQRLRRGFSWGVLVFVLAWLVFQLFARGFVEFFSR
ncbi:hypothetical protein ACSDQ9_10220 [Aestuariimicrobium soli]|uniref:hypothetical protein n=1 Tax=Aestuariimicrobium soli TaxID=2035834 RepID=UPI003EBDA0A5